MTRADIIQAVKDARACPDLGDAVTIIACLVALARLDQRQALAAGASPSPKATEAYAPVRSYLK